MFERLPEQSFDLDVKLALSDTIVLYAAVLEPLEVLTVHQKVHQFEDAFGPTDVLFDRFLDCKTFRVNHLTICGGSRLPFRRWYYLKDSRIAHQVINLRQILLHAHAKLLKSRAELRRVLYVIECLPLHLLFVGRAQRRLAARLYGRDFW